MPCYQTRSTTRTGTGRGSSEMEDLNRTRATTGTGTETSSEMEGLNNYNELLKCRTTTEEEPEVMEPECTRNAWNAFQEQHKGKKNLPTIWKGMLMDEKQKYGKKGHKVRVVVQCSTKKFLDSLEKLGPERRKMLEDSPFHRILAMKRGIQNNKRIKQLASIFNTEERCLEILGVKYVVTPGDFSHIMGVEDGEEDVMVGGIAPNDLKKVFSKGKGNIDMKKVVKQLTRGEDEDNVKRAYALLALSHVICAQRNLRDPFLALVEDVEGLKKKKWATYAIERLVEGIERYKTSKGNEERRIRGCTIFLQLYAEKMIPKENLPFDCDDKRGKRKRDKDCNDSPKTVESRFLDAKETVQEQVEEIKVIFQNKRKKNNVRYKNNPVKKNTADVVLSSLGGHADDIEARFPKDYDEYVEGVAARKR